MALSKEIFGFYSVLFILLKAQATIGISKSTCPSVEIADTVCPRNPNRCSSDRACSDGLKCCPSSEDKGCSLRCVEPRDLKGCPEPLDFAFVVDTSGSISRRNFKKLKAFIEQMIDGFDISEEGTHVALVEYSTSASVVLKFDNFKGVHLNAVNLKRKARKIPHKRGYTYIDRGLHLADTEVFTVKDGMRPNVTKIVLVMTDGKQTVEENKKEDGVLPSDILRNAVQPLKDKGIRVISLGVGKGFELFDLVTLASTDLDVYTATDFGELTTLVTELTKGNCPVHGNWSDWGEWSNCTVSCGGGEQTRYRDCDNPPPAHGGRQCPGASEETRPCNELLCAVDGGWTEWKPWEICPVTCGGGIQNRSRTCTDPPPAHGGKDCSGEGALTRPCNEEPCPADGNWSEWSEFTLCSVSCGGGRQNRSRTCTNPPPKNDGKYCAGESSEIRPCNTLPCPVDGGWSSFGEWGSCSLTCGGGVQDRQRTCTNPPPAHGGRPCEGSNVETRFCAQFSCPGDGKWSAWKPWSPCSVSCALGTQSRSRTCTNPPPTFGGRDCIGKSDDTKSCNNGTCPVNGRWTRWNPWSSCPVRCGGGTQVRLRSCTNPPPAFGGANCIGERRQAQPCNEQPCEVHGNWARWQSWSICSKSCGGGDQSRMRNCTNPAPLHGGRQCSGRNKETRSCNRRPCPVDGNWADWKPWGSCSRPCAGGKQIRWRTCTNPQPSNGGSWCIGNRQETKSCNEDKLCPVNGGWSFWGYWDRCSVSCGAGVRYRARTCNNPPPAHGGARCRGESREISYCESPSCPVDGNWGQWGRFSRCSKRCSGGIKRRYRFCSNPRRSNGGKDCLGEGVEEIPCNTRPCSVNGNWGRWDSWSSCSVTCGGLGLRIRRRQCNNPPPSHGGRYCPGSSSLTVSCAVWLPCEVNCNIPLDFAIIVDTSGSISSRNFRRLRQFIYSLVDGFKVAEEYTHIAIIEYSTAASVQLHFNDLSGKNLTRHNINKKVQSMPHKKGFTYIDRALRRADQEVFTYAAGMRYDADKVALVMTDGEQTVEKNSAKSDIEILTEASKPLKDKGVRILSLGIGRRANKKSLEAISSGSDVYSAETFSELRLLVRKLKKGTCQATAAGYKYVRRKKKI